MEIERDDDSEDESPDKRSCAEINLPLRSREDVWEAFGFNDSQLKKLPSKTDRSKGQATATQRAHLARIVARAATRVAEILFPGDTSTLLQAVGDRLQGKSDAPVEQQFDKLLTAAGKVLAASPKSSVQRRVSRFQEPTSAMMMTVTAAVTTMPIPAAIGVRQCRPHSKTTRAASRKVLWKL